MKAAIWVSPHKLEIRDIPIPEPKEKEVLIKVLGCGVCGTDVHIFDGEVPLAKPPQVLGHEIYGEVSKLGDGVKGIDVGELISVNPVVGCDICGFCQEGKTNLCAKPTIIGYARTGGFAQYTTVPQSHLFKVSKNMGAKGGILAETLACVLNGYDRLNMRAGSSVLILGAGSVGLLWTDLIQSSLRTNLIQTDIIKKRLDVAKSLGAKIVDASKSGWQSKVTAIEPEGVDYIIDATGTAKAISESLGLIRKGGTLMVFGVCPEEERVSISPYEMFAKELSIIAGKMPPGTLLRAVKIIEAGLIHSEEIVTTTMPLSKLGKAIEAFKKDKSKHIKIMIDPWIN